MPVICPITHAGHVVALVAGDHAILADELTGEVRHLIKAKCLYALEVNAAERPGPYTDQDAERFAHDVLQQRAATRDRLASRRSRSSLRR